MGSEQAQYVYIYRENPANFSTLSYVEFQILHATISHFALV